MDVYKIIITSKAQSDLAECVSFVLNASEEAAKKLANDIYSSIKALETFPERNAIFEMPRSYPFTIRKLIINARYVALYSTEGKNIVVHRILDARRNLENLIL